MLAATALALALIGAVLVWAATRDVERAAGNNPNGYLYRHLINLAIAAVLMFGASRLDARMLRRSGPFVYLAGIFGLLLVLAAGVTINGAHAWIRLGGGFEIQPSEFMKLGLVIGMAVLFAQRGRDRGDLPPTTVDVLLALGLIAVPLVLIMLQPDLGSAMVLGAAAFGVLIAAGVRARWTIGLLVVRDSRRDPRREDGPARRLPARALQCVHRPAARPAGRGVQHQPGAHRDRQRRLVRHGPVQRTADQRRLRARAAHRLRVLGDGRGVRARRRHRAHRCCSRCCAGAGWSSPARPIARASSSPSASCAGSPSRRSRTSA